MTTIIRSDIHMQCFYRTEDKHIGGDVPLSDKKIKLE